MGDLRYSFEKERLLGLILNLGSKVRMCYNKSKIFP